MYIYMLTHTSLFRFLWILPFFPLLNLLFLAGLFAGIPGFDDADLPKVIGVFVGAVLLLNHFLSRDSVITPAQWV